MHCKVLGLCVCVCKTPHDEMNDILHLSLSYNFNCNLQLKLNNNTFQYCSIFIQKFQFIWVSCYSLAFSLHLSDEWKEFIHSNKMV